VREVIDLLRLNYERIVARHGLPSAGGTTDPSPTAEPAAAEAPAAAARAPAR
jgi:hypothetical protein